MQRVRNFYEDPFFFFNVRTSMYVSYRYDALVIIVLKSYGAEGQVRMNY